MDDFVFFFAAGIVASVMNIKKHNFVIILWLSFFLVTIGRVTFSVTAVYGGLRQIMEFIGPFALIGGLGALVTRNILVKSIIPLPFMKNVSQSVVRFFVSIVILLTFVPIFFEMVRLHPNQNIYMNKFIGGLSGAAERNFPGYGNTFGNVYLQGVEWLNKHADKNAKVILEIKIPRIKQSKYKNPFISFCIPNNAESAIACVGVSAPTP